MYRRAFAFVAATLIAIALPQYAAAQGVTGTWKVTYVTAGTSETTVAIVRLTTEGGKTTGEMLAGSPRFKNLTFKFAAQEGARCRVLLMVGKVEMTFEANVPKDANKQIKGVMTVGNVIYPAWLSATDETTLDLKSSARAVDCPPMQEARTLTNKVLLLRTQAFQTKDAEKKKDLLKQAADADKVAKKETPGLYRDVLAKHGDSPAVFEAALSLMRSAQTNESKVDDVKAWANAAGNAAKAYGPQWQSEVAVQTATVLAGQDGFASLAVDYAHQAEKLLPAKAAPADEIRVLHILTRALRKSGKVDDAKKYDVRIAKLDDILDADYVTKMPPFKGEAFAGRKGKSDRTVFMELFTGAACPPCVAADLAFDVLQKTYKPSELVLIQYHMHIPGPDPMTNPDTEKRWAYYGKEVKGVPSSLFNGKPKAGGGGGVDNAEAKYSQYRKVIDPLLEEDTAIKLTAKALRKGDQIDIQVDVAGVPDPGANKKVRVLLTEETVKYPGSNKIRMHHNVVRAFPGGVEGKELMEANSTHKSSIVLGDLRTQLTKYLDDFQAGGKSFYVPPRPMALDHLRVIAFVQDDATREILQAVQVDVNGK